MTGDGNLHTYRNTHMQVTHISHNITLMTLTTFCIVYICYTCSRIACIAYSKKVKDIYILNFLWTYHHRVVYVVAFVKYRMHNINKLINSFLVINIAKFIIINRVNEVVIATCMFASFHVCRSVLLFQKYSLLILVFGHCYCRLWFCQNKTKIPQRLIYTDLKPFILARKKRGFEDLTLVVQKFNCKQRISPMEGTCKNDDCVCPESNKNRSIFKRPEIPQYFPLIQCYRFFFIITRIVL